MEEDISEPNRRLHMMSQQTRKEEGRGRGQQGSGKVKVTTMSSNAPSKSGRSAQEANSRWAAQHTEPVAN